MSDRHKTTLINDPPDTWYVVMNWRTDEVTYTGKSLAAATDALVPGTCFGKAATDVVAKEICREYCLRAKGVKIESAA